MALLGNNFIDLIDLYRRQNPDGSIADIIEMVSQENPILDDALAVQCNSGAKHITTIRTGLPEGTWGGTVSGHTAKQEHHPAGGRHHGLYGTVKQRGYAVTQAG